jgi:hypothetical protein
MYYWRVHMSKTIMLDAIPRTLFGVQFNMKLNDDTWTYNNYEVCADEHYQNKYYDILVATPEIYSEVKKLKWCMNANEVE